MDRDDLGSHHSSGEDVSEHSPETAGLARGLARSAVPKGAARITVGRLPLRADQMMATKARAATRTASRTANRTASPTTGRMARIRRVAKVSDRAATGLDVVDAATEAPTKEGWRTRATNFAGSLLKNTILGMAVFATYEEVMDQFEKNRVEKKPYQQASNLIQDVYQKDNSPPTELWQHYAAGFCAGSAHAGLGSAIERMTTFVWQNRYLSPGVTLPSTAAGTAFLPNFVLHAKSHAVLFGSYETVKRAATMAMGTNNTPATDIDENNIEQPSEDNGFLDGQLMAVALAGGTAGIFQQFVSDVVEQATKALQTKRPSMSRLLASIEPPKYTAKSLLMLSLPTSIGFVAFEYGREAVMTD